MSKYTTLVFKSDDEESCDFVRNLSKNEYCKAWSIDNEILRLELIEQALEDGDIEKAKSYIGETDLERFIN